MTASVSTRQTTRLGAASTWPYFVLALVLPVFAVAPLFYPGYIQTHSGFGLLWNVADLRANLGQWTWLPHLATQFDPLRGDGLLPYYLAALLPLPPAAAVKVILGLGWLLGSAGMFLWLKSWLGHHGALVGALIYVYLPCQIVAAYVRGAWGETLFLGLLPWAILAATFLVTSPRLLILPAAALVWLGLGLSQLGLTMAALVFVALLVLVIHPRQSLLPVLAALLGTAAAAAFYLPLSPLFVDSPHLFADHFLYPFQLFSAHWDFGPSRPGWNDGLSLQLGVAAVGLAAISLVLWQHPGLANSPVRRADRRLVFFCGCGPLSWLCSN